MAGFCSAVARAVAPTQPSSSGRRPGAAAATPAAAAARQQQRPAGAAAHSAADRVMGANTARCGRRSRVPRAAAAEVVTATVPQATALPELPPLDDNYEATCSFTDVGNWLIPGRLMAGRYPFVEPGRCRSHEVGEAQLRELVQAGLTTFVCLQAELPPQESMRIGGLNGFLPYRATAQLLASSLSPPPSIEEVSALRTPELDRYLPPRRRPSAYQQRARIELNFSHCPIVDLSVPDADRLRLLLSELAGRLEAGENLYVHCWGGRGRAGTVGACLLAHLYGITADEALERVQRAFDTRKDDKRRSPETEEQVAFVRRFIADSSWGMPPRRNRQTGLGRGLRWLAVMSTAILLAVVVTQPGRPLRGARQLGEAGDHVVGPNSSAAAAAAIEAALGRTATGDGAAGAARLSAERSACIAAAVNGPVPVFGRVTKAGPLPMHLLDGPNTSQRHQAYFAWRDFGVDEEQTQQAVVNGVPTRVGRAPPLFPYCRILVNHNYRTMYLKAPKTGSTSVLTLLGTCTGNNETDKATCFKPLEVMPSLEDYAAMYARYFVWTVARNPWARAVSSYRMLSRYMKHGCKDRVGGWNTVCMDVNHIPRVHNVYPLCTIDRQRGEGFALHHFIGQAPCLVTEEGEWAADYVVRTENLAEDMRGVLEEMNQRRHPEAPALDVGALLGQLTNVNRVHVSCKGYEAPAAAGESGGAAAAASSGGAAGGEVKQFSKEIVAVSRRRALAGDKPHAVHLEASESYCNTEQYFLEEHAQCFDAIAAYYQHDMRLFQLPDCRG
ncbi:MAP kinase phosphatase 6 isoform B [Micractinium conductrix]|uniref:MAP kinase phosphatase 6 isoform B n=1 Tax=Micractinium conductrix TaxID=554055 RepID=A0A2P6VHE4_9CHLO|nr:MAP kinase phosphatase 6 isoform B [Micractinium conductrix]|eukprot:PSC73500.1 MAP kinase phosphatase 6 isoform B [Micractinium conductrix]